jgi:hypothetical protein
VNQDILNLYKKAQKGGLNAQEVFWLEGQAASHPCFGMAYMILARHHYRNQSTIKNKALLKAAAYSNNRTLLRHYLEDTLATPKSRPIPVSEMKPILEKKEQEKSTLNLDKKEAIPPVTEPLPKTPKAEVSEVEILATETPVSEAPEVETPKVEAPEAEPQAVETPKSEAPEAEPPAIESPKSEAPEVESPATEGPEIHSENSANSENSAPPAVNWFLHMRVKLRADKYKTLGNRIRTSIAKHAPALAATAEAAVAITDAPAVETPAAESPAVEAPIETPASEAPIVEAPIETAIVDAHIIESVVPETSAIEAAVVEQPALEAKAEETKAEVEGTKPEVKEKPTVPDKEYEIGSFSSFTFLSEGDNEDTEDVIDTGIATLEAVEFQTSEAKDGSGEIIFEENDRIIEISVSPEALNKYFKGRLPSEQPMTFGEFKIELDELEYRTPEENPAPTEVNSPKQKVENPRQKSEAPKQKSESPELNVEAPAEEQPRKKVDDILEKFIENEPGITRGNLANSPTGDLAKDSSLLNEEWVTETLARIYAKQGNKAKAIKIYGKLRLRFPEKSDYFGSLIENLKQ